MTGEPIQDHLGRSIHGGAHPTSRPTFRAARLIRPADLKGIPINTITPHALTRVLLGLLLALSFSAQAVSASEETIAQASRRVVSQYSADFPSLPKAEPSKTVTTGPLLGNGDMATSIARVPEGLRFWLCKNDFWKLARDFKVGPSGPRGFGGLDITFPGLGGGWATRQDLYQAVTVSTCNDEKRASRVVVRSWVAATQNKLVIELAASGNDTEVRVNLWAQDGNGSQVTRNAEDQPPWATRRFAEGVEIPTEVACAVVAIGPDASVFTLKADQPVTIVLAMQSAFKSESPLEDVRKQAAGMDQDAVDELQRDHAAWWQQFWSRSYIEIGDPLIEQRYYLSHYVMACASRDPRFPPSLFGTWITSDEPAWMGDYHLNYNHMAPYYGLYSSNHLEQAEPYEAPILDFRSRAQWYAKNALDLRGVYYPVGIGPLGIETTLGYPDDGYARPEHFEKGGLFYGQKSNAAYCLVNVAMRWYLTYDTDYARKLYPLVRDVADFWEDYLQFDGERYVIENDAIHERSRNDFNSIVSLGLVRNTVALALDMSSELGVDADRHEQWNHILDHLSGWTYQELALPRLPGEDRGIEKPKVKVFRYTERGTAWWRNNTLAIQHIYPAGAIGLDSPEEVLEVARNTIDVRNGWVDSNGTNSFYPAAVRVGYDPQVILNKLRELIAHRSAPNGFKKGNPHGIENCSTVPNTINEMLCMGHQGVLRVFPVWPRDMDATFAGIRAWGAFLVSAQIKAGQVQYVEIYSERGRRCTIDNPWPGQEVRVTRRGGKVESLSGDRLMIDTEVGETLRLVRP